MTSWLTSKHARPGLGGNLWGQRGWGDGKEHDYWACLLGKIISIVPCVIRDVILILGGEPVGFWGSCCSSFMRAGGLRPKTRAQVWRLRWRAVFGVDYLNSVRYLGFGGGCFTRMYRIYEDRRPRYDTLFLAYKAEGVERHPSIGPSIFTSLALWRRGPGPASKEASWSAPRESLPAPCCDPSRAPPQGPDGLRASGF